MKTWLAIAFLLLAFIGPITQHGRANWISIGSVLPLVVLGLILIFKAAGGKTNILE